MVNYKSCLFSFFYQSLMSDQPERTDSPNSYDDIVSSEDRRGRSSRRKSKLKIDTNQTENKPTDEIVKRLVNEQLRTRFTDIQTANDQLESRIEINIKELENWVKKTEKKMEDIENQQSKIVQSTECISNIQTNIIETMLISKRKEKLLYELKVDSINQNNYQDIENLINLDRKIKTEMNILDK